jgi:hypothetical protein
MPRIVADGALTEEGDRRAYPCSTSSRSWRLPTAVVSMMPDFGLALRDAALPVAVVLRTLY